MTPRILIIAGSDSGGGAGIQADIKTVTMLGGHAMTAVTAITAQNTLGVQAVLAVPTGIVLAQIDSVVSDIGVDAVKIGMIGSADTANAVADVLARLDVPIVFDPVMVATSGSMLADAATIAAFERLMRIASVVTPNLPELNALTTDAVRAEPVEARSRPERPSTSSGRTEELAQALASRIGTAALAKGGHAGGYMITDTLVTPDGYVRQWHGTRIDTRHTHGTGCTLASGIATGLGQGMQLADAISRARRFVRGALIAAPGIGKGHGPIGHALGVAPFDELQR